MIRERRLREALTLVEMLVAIGVVGLLVAVSVPAVQSARESARKLHCANNLKQLALGVHGFEAREGYLPPAFTDIDATNLDLRKHNLVAYLLPDIDEPGLADRYSYEFHWFEALRPTPETSNHTLTQQRIELALCPSAQVGDQLPVSDYSVCLWFNAGPNSARDRLVAAGRLSPRPDWSSILSPFTHSNHEFVRIYRGMVTDGMSNSMMLFEDGGRPDYYVSGRQIAGSGRVPLSGALWADADAPFAIHNLCGDSMINCNNDNEIYAFHQEGANTAFGDGAVRFISAAIDPEAFASQFTRSGGDTL